MKDLTLKINDIVLAIYVLAVCVFLDGSIYIKLSRIILFGCYILYICYYKKIIINQYTIWLIAFMGYAIIIIPFSYSLELAISGTKTMIVNCMTMVALVGIIQTSVRWIDIVTKMLIISPVLSGALLFAKEGIGAFLGTRYVEDTGYSANTLGAMAAFGAVLSFFTLKKMIIRTKYAMVYRVLFFVNVLCVLLSGSKKAFVYMFLPFVFYVLLNSKSLRELVKKVGFVVIIFIFVLILVMNVPMLYDLLGSRIVGFINTFMGEGRDGSTTFRIRMIMWGIDWFADNPVLGYGADNFRGLVGRYDTWAGPSGTYAHNNFIEILVDFGVIGFCIYYYIYYKIAQGLINAVKKDNEIKMIYGSIFLTTVIGELATVSYVNKYSTVLLAIVWCLMSENHIDKLGEKE